MNLFLDFILLTAALYNLVLAGIVLVKSHAQRARYTFAWYILSTVAWTLCIVFVQIFPRNPLNIWLLRAAHSCAIVIVINWLLFCAQFPIPSPRFSRFARWLILASLPWLIIPWGKWLIPGIQMASWGVDAIKGPLMLPYTAWIGLTMAAGIFHLFSMGKQLRGLERLQIRYILLGAIGLVLSGAIPNLILPIITNSYRFGPYSPLASLFVTTTTTYAIVRYRLMDIKIILRAGLVYSVTIGTLSLLFALLVPLLNSTLTSHFRLPNGAGSIFLALVIAMAFQPFRHYVQLHVDRFFFKSVYDYRLTLREAGSALASALDQNMLVETLVNALLRTLRPIGVSVFLPAHDELMAKIMETGEPFEIPEAIRQQDPLLRFALDTDEVLLTDELVRQNTDEKLIGITLKSGGVFVVLPLIASNRLCGLVFLGEKLSGDVYTSDDIGLLRILGKQAAIALDNAKHYHEMVLMNDYHARLLQIMQDGVIALDPELLVITFNAAAERITGVAAAEALGKRLDVLGLERFTSSFTTQEGQEVTITTRDGDEVPVLVTVTPFTRRWDIGASHLIVFRDLSTLRALEQEKMQAERFSSMGAMAASLAHEIKNPLVPIQLFAHLLPQKYDEAEFREEFSTTVVHEVERISSLVGQMLDLVRQPTLAIDRSQVDIHEILTHVTSQLNLECERNKVQLSLNIPREIPPIIGVPTQLYQAVLNVLVNAVQVLPDGGKIGVTAEVTETRFVLRITDSGPGVPPAELPHIFEPLFTTKTGGHGLGLALTYQFIRAHGGEIRAECQAGSGLSVVMAIPIASKAELELICS